MRRLAVRNLFQNRIRLAISVGGVSLALMLILALDAVLTGMEERVTAYIDRSGADVWVAQEGVRNMHMASSSLPASVQAEVEAVAGVDSVTPILYVTNLVVSGEERNLAYIIGVPDGGQSGGPWQMVEGRDEPGPGEAVIDVGVASKSRVGVGDEVSILGRSFKIIGLSRGTANLVSSVAFIRLGDFAALRGGPEIVSFLLVRVKPDETPEAVADRIQTEVGNVTALPREAFAREERQVIRDMSTDVLAIMNLVGFLIGLAVMALTVYTATLARRAEYGVLKAIGARNGRLYHTVAWQALLSVAMGFSAGLLFTWLLSAAVPYLSPSLSLRVSSASLFKVGGLSVIIAMLSAALPIKQIAGLDPALVFRGK